jgi:hypothetical protein
MTLSIRSFDNKSHTGDALFKALGHPAVGGQVADFIARLAGFKKLAVVDPWDQFTCFTALYDLPAGNLDGPYVQRLEDLGAPGVKSLLDLAASGCDGILLAAFDADLARRSIAPLIDPTLPVLTFDELRLPETRLSNRRRYLDPLNFATNFSLFRAGNGRRSIVRTANYWSGYGAKEPKLWLMLFDGTGQKLAEWEEALAPQQSIVLDAEQVRQRFGLPPFEGTLLMHALGVAGHDMIKYVLDDVDDRGRDPAVTHDSNNWPAEYYSGLPAPRAHETVTLWLQNPHPKPVPAGAITLNLMGDANSVQVSTEIPGFGVLAIDTRALLPDAAWPQQIEAATFYHVIRPRYEILGNGHVTFAHMNVERADLQPNPAIAQAAPHVGKGFLLPAPILPLGKWRSIALPTPAARGQAELPLKLLAYDQDGRQVLEKPLGVLLRNAMPELDLNAALAAVGIADPAFEGHCELIYDFAPHIDVDGWLHGLFRYEQHDNGQMGDTSFGAHMFNIPLTLKDEPQSYAGRAPGISSRLFARLMPHGLDAFVHLTYPSSDTWWPHSDTLLVLHDGLGEKLAETKVQIPLHGSRLLRASGLFTADDLAKAGPKGYILITDRTCRLFGYHGVLGDAGQFCLDHMFGF